MFEDMIRRKTLLGSIVFFAALLIWASALNYNRISSILEERSRAMLNQEWATMRGCLRLQRNPNTGTIQEYWYYDSADPDETAAVNRIRESLLVADENGNVITGAAAYERIGLDTSSQIRERIKETVSAPAGRGWFYGRNAQGLPYLIRYGVVRDEYRRSPYYVAIDAPLSHNHEILRTFTWNLGGVIACALLLGWSLGRIVLRREDMR